MLKEVVRMPSLVSLTLGAWFGLSFIWSFVLLWFDMMWFDLVL
jgi:hypothetical protein